MVKKKKCIYLQQNNKIFKMKKAAVESQFDESPSANTRNKNPLPRGSKLISQPSQQSMYKL